MSVINTNVPALLAQRNLNVTAFNLSKSIERLSSGLRINRAGDDAAGLSISEKLRSQVRGLTQAGRNIQDGVSLLQTAEGALGEIESILQRMRELAVQAANDTLTATDRSAITTETDQLITALDKIATQTKFNTKVLLGGALGYSFTTGIDGAATGIDDVTVSDTTVFNDYLTRVGGGANSGTFTLTISSGTNWSTSNNVARVTLTDGTGNYLEAIDNVAVPSSTGDQKNIKFTTFGVTLTVDSTVYTAPGAVSAAVSGTLLTIQAGASAGETYTSVSISNFTPGSGKFTATTGLGANMTTAAGASAAMSYLDAMITSVSTQRALLGANQNTLESMLASVDISRENTVAAESRIRDLDVSAEMVAFTKTQILQQAGTAVLAQANQSPQTVLQLLR